MSGLLQEAFQHGLKIQQDLSGVVIGVDIGVDIGVGSGSGSGIGIGIGIGIGNQRSTINDQRST
jgi:hypothetical protein